MSAANPIHGEGISLADMGIDSADVGLRPSEVARRYAGKEAVEMYETDEPRPSFDGREERQADIFSSFVNLTNSIIGSGMLGLPFAFAASGWFLGFFFITIAGVATVLSLHLLSLCSLKVKSPASFYRIAEATIPKWAFMIDLSVASMCFGISSSYLIVIGTLMPQVIDFFGGSGFIAERYLWVTIGFCIVGPISCLKSLDALKYTSTLAVLIVVFIACLAASFALSSDLSPCGDDATDDQSCVGDFSVVTFDIGTIKALGVFIFGYSCQMNIFPVVNELKNPSIGRFNIVIYMSIGAAFLLYVTVAAGGYGTYGTSVESDLLLSYPSKLLAVYCACGNICCGGVCLIYLACISAIGVIFICLFV